MGDNEINIFMISVQCVLSFKVGLLFFFFFLYFYPPHLERERERKDTSDFSDEADKQETRDGERKKRQTDIFRRRKRMYWGEWEEERKTVSKWTSERVLIRTVSRLSQRARRIW